jgi:hypothetical protein
MSAQIIVQHANGPKASWKVSWKVVDEGSKAAAGQRFFQSADVIFEPIEAPAAFTLRDTDLCISLQPEGGSRSGNEIQSTDVGHLNFEFLLETLEVSITAARAVKLIAPRGNGNIIRSNILPNRMHDVECVERTAALALPLQLFTGEEWTTSTSLVALLKGSAGAIRLQNDSSTGTEEVFAFLEKELDRRLCMPLLATGLERQTIVIVEGGETFPFDGACSAQLYEAGESLGIDIVVLAVEGHDIQRRPEFAHWCKAFIPVECGYDAGFPARIVAAVKQYAKESGRPIDGIVTTYESYHIAVSTAAEELGLPCEPISAYEIATNKFKTSIFEGRKSFTASNVKEALHIARTEDVLWPIIIKPCRGWASELVFKVNDIQQLEEAAPYMRSDRHGTQFVMEHYCDGPEVDINFVMYDGEVLFWGMHFPPSLSFAKANRTEIGDENPKSAETGSDSFGELDYLLPSQLPENEQQAIYDSVLQSITRLGFRNGIYHCEARVDNSTMEWRFNASHVPEMAPRQTHNGKPAVSWLVEINTRPPGLDTCDIIRTTWGVDYWALLLITKLRNASDQARALSQPYRGGAQYHADKVWVLAAFNEPKKGIWESGNVTEELALRRPDIAKHLSKHLTFPKKGDKVPHPSTGVNKFVAYLHVFSRKSRAHLLDLATEARKELKIEYS